VHPRPPSLILFSLDVVTFVRKFHWSGLTALFVVILGNGLTAALWFRAIFSTTEHTHARYFLEAGLSFAIGGATFLLALPFIIVGSMHLSARWLAAACLLFAFTPIPLGMVLMHALADFRHITLSP
jgi:hypothetical protein